MQGGYGSFQSAGLGAPKAPHLSSLLGGEDQELADGAAASMSAAHADDEAERASVVAVLAKRAKRVRQCRSVPLSLLLYVVFIGALVSHCRVEPAFELESALSSELVVNTYFDVYSLTTPTQWFAWARNALLPVLLYDPVGVVESDDYGAPYVKAPQRPGRIVNNYGLIIGGVRLSQIRSRAAPCGDGGVFAKIYNDTCYDFGAPPSGEGGFGDAAAAAAAGVEGAFQPQTSGGGLLPELVDAYDDGPFFQLYLDGMETLASGQAKVTGLEEAFWLDEASQVVAVQIALYNGQTNFFATVEMATTFTPGGRLDVASRVGSFSANPYLGAAAGAYVLDFMLSCYALYLLRSTLKRLVASMREPGDLLTKLSHVFQLWRMLDVGASVFLWTSIGLWISFCVKLAAIRREVYSDGGASPETYTTGAQAETARQIFAAFETFSSFKIAAAWALIFLSLRLFKYFQFQPRLAVITDSLIMAFKDGVHFALLFAVLLTLYGVWGHFMFGTQCPDWRTVSSSIVAVFRYMMYDYDLVAMEATGFVHMADFFFVSYMIVITNLILWMFLAIILESYTTIRAAQFDTPSLADELTVLLRSLPAPADMLPSQLARLLGARRAAAAGGGGGGGAVRRALSAQEMLDAIDKGSLARGPITAERLSSVFGLPRDEAEAIVSEAARLLADGVGGVHAAAAAAGVPLAEAVAAKHGQDPEDAGHATVSDRAERAVGARETRHIITSLSRAMTADGGAGASAAGADALLLRVLTKSGLGRGGGRASFGEARAISRPTTRSGMAAGCAGGGGENVAALSSAELDASIESAQAHVAALMRARRERSAAAADGAAARI
jgi:hypothetical protein